MMRIISRRKAIQNPLDISIALLSPQEQLEYEFAV